VKLRTALAPVSAAIHRALAPLRTKAAVSALSFRDVWGYAKESFPGAWQRNVVQDNRESVLAFAAVYACVTRIAQDIGKLRIKLVQRDAKGIWSEAQANSPYWLVLRKPNHYQNRIQFLTEWLLMKLLHGNAFILKERDDRNMVRAMYVLDSRRVQIRITEDGGVYYSLSGDQLAGIPQGLTVPASEIIHDRGPTLFHPLCGVSPIFACASSATQGNRIQANSATFFENMSRPSGMLTADGTIDDATAARLKREWEDNYSGRNLGKIAVGGDGLKYLPFTIPAEQAQLIEQLKWTVEDVARAFGMPLYKIGAAAVPTNNNVEALNQQYYTDCLQVLIEAMELCLDEGLGVPADLGTELDLTGLLRMDGKTQIEMLAAGVKGGLVAPNEGRSRLNLPALDGGDTIYLQEQNYSLAALAKRDAKDDPFAKPGATPAPAPAPAAPAATDDEAKAQEQVAAFLDQLTKAFDVEPA
jgi:HK97 family phage portal protein